VHLHKDHLEIARRIAARSMVLLKNKNGLLPLPKKGKRIAVIGPMANEKRALMGSWTLDGRAEDVITIIEGIKRVAPEANIITSSSGLMDDMIYAARHADIIVIAVGESQIRSGEANSVADLELSPGQEELVETVHRFGKPVVVVVCAGRPLAITKIDAAADAVLYAWHPGTQGGLAVADILFGDVNPSGKLPVTFPRTAGQIPLYYNHKSTGRAIDEYFNKSHFLNYHDQTGKPLYPFGFGLSYTTFEYDHLKIEKTEVQKGEEVKVSVQVTNRGKVAGEEIVQCYVSDKVSSTTRPVRELKAFRRVHLQPGESKTVAFTLDEEALSFYGQDGKRILEPGVFTVWIGGNCLTELGVDFRVL